MISMVDDQTIQDYFCYFFVFWRVYFIIQRVPMIQL